MTSLYSDMHDWSYRTCVECGDDDVMWWSKDANKKVVCYYCKYFDSKRSVQDDEEGEVDPAQAGFTFSCHIHL